MKKNKQLYFQLLVLLMTIYACTNSTKAEFNQIKANAKPHFIQEHNSTEIFTNIEEKINNAFIKALLHKEYKDLDTLLEKINETITLNTNNNLTLYWKSFLIYNKALSMMLHNNDDEAKLLIKQADEIMSELKNKNSEDYALYSLIKSLNMKYIKNTAEIISESKIIKKYCDYSIKLEPKNLRPYFVKASLDFYTPEKYGGGRDCEKLLLKAISLNEQIIANQYFPSWGKDQSYEMLIKYYIRKNKIDIARKYYKEAILIFPNNFMIKQLASKLI